MNLPPGSPPEPPRRRWWLAWRVAAAAVGVVGLSGGATAAIALNEVSRLTEALEQNKPVKLAPNVLAPTSRGAPETLLLVGNDERPAPKDNPIAGPVLPHSNEMVLVRIDPSKPTISMLSIPREWKVPIDEPDGEVEENRINSAYTYGWENGGGTAGGVKLMVETIERVLPGITINRVFVTNFKKFEEAVNAMGCVYMTVDKRYYHSNAEPGAEQYFEINLRPGYQKLCGQEALEFVANRHESTSLIRDARDQRFLLEAKAEYGASLFSQREKFEQIFGRYVESTLDNEEDILQLLYLLVESAGKPVRQVEFHVNLEPTFDSATPEEVHEAVASFLSGTTAIQHQTVAPAHPAAARPTRSPTSARSILDLPLTPTTSTELEEARAQAPNLPFPLEYPRVRDSVEGAEPDELRLYQIHDLHGHAHPIYCVVIDRGEVGQYYDVQGTNWTDPPMLADPGQTVHLGKRTYELFYAGEKVRAIAWREHGAVYWIENTLTNDVSAQALLAMAAQTVPVIATPASPPVTTNITPATRVDLAPRPAATTTESAKLEALLGFVGLAVVALLSPLVLARQRELSRLREAVANALALETRQRPLLAASGAPIAVAPAPAATAPVPAPTATAPAPAAMAMAPVPAPTATAPAPAATAMAPARGTPPADERPRSVYRARRHFVLSRRDGRARA